MFKKTAIIGIGVGAGPVLQLVATPWLSRIYSPEEFGSFALFLSSASVLMTITCLRYEAVIPVVEDKFVKHATLVALFSAFVMLLLSSVIVWTGVPHYLYQPFVKIGSQMWGIPVAAACGGIMLLVYYLTLRQGKYVLNAVMRSSQPMMFVVLAVGLSGGGLIQAQIFSWIFVAFVGLAYIARDVAFIRWKALWATAVRFRQYPTLLTITSLLDAAALAFPVFLISSAYGVEATGNFSQLQRLIGSPMLLGSAVIGQMFFKYSGELFRSGKSSGPLMWRSVKILGGMAMLLLLVLAIVGESMCKWLLGSGWRVDTLFILLVTFPLVFRTAISPISTVFLTHHRVGLGVRWQVGYFVTTCGVLYSASQFFDFESFLLVYGIHELIMYAVYLAMANRVVSVSTV